MRIAHIGTSLPNREDRDWVVSQELIDEAGITYRQLDYWCRTGLLHAIDGSTPGSGWARRFNQDQVTRASLLHDLLDAGFSLQICRQIIDDLLVDRRVDVGQFTLTVRPTHQEAGAA